MFFNSKNIVAQRISPSPFIEVNSDVILDYYVTDAVAALSLDSIEFKLEVMSGRSTTNAIPWTAIDISGVTDDIYTFTLNPGGNIKVGDKIQLVLRITDTDGVDAYYKDTEVEPI